MSLNVLADIWELVPELFYLPDLYINWRNINFGAMMDGTVVNHIELPSWTNSIPFKEDDAKGNPFVFVAKLMELLESEEVR